MAILTLNRPEVSNGFNIPACQEILEAIRLVKDNPSLRFLVIKAKGKVFSVGGDLVEMQNAVERDDVQSLVKIAELVQDISFAIKQLPKPVILCADGAVAGAAFNIALAVDFCIASTQTKFIQAFVNVGLAPDAGGLFLLTRAVGLNRATHLVMTGEGVTAEKGLEYGFVYRAAESDKLDKTCSQLLKRLRRGSSNSYAGMKSLVWQSFLQVGRIMPKKSLLFKRNWPLRRTLKRVSGLMEIGGDQIFKEIALMCLPNTLMSDIL